MKEKNTKVDRLVPKTMTEQSPKAQMSRGEARVANALRTTRSTKEIL